MAVLMAVQPDPRPSTRKRERNAQLLCEIIDRVEHRLRRQAQRHAELPDDADDVLQSACVLFLERYDRPRRTARLALHDREAGGVGDSPARIPPARVRLQK
ncbi:MAG: hypothetical protein ACRDNG_06525 [Gaiellaceae bacterium]